jgi:hypothetical protein
MGVTMPQRLRFQLSLPPSEIIARIADETVAFESVLNIRSPVHGYGTFLKESLTGPRQFLSKIQGDSFAIMTIGMWPFKGGMITPNVGRMQGTVRPSGPGSIVEAGFRVFPAFLITTAAMGSVFAFFAGLLLLLVLSTGAQMDLGTRAGSLIVSGVLLCLGLICAAYVPVSARAQKEATSRFLDRLFADLIARSRPPVDRGDSLHRDRRSGRPSMENCKFNGKLAVGSSCPDIDVDNHCPERACDNDDG